jgi:hypothetical protein
MQKDTLVVLTCPHAQRNNSGCRGCISRFDTTQNDACLGVGLQWKQHTDSAGRSGRAPGPKCDYGK